MKHEALRTQVYEASQALHRSGLVPLTWGNVSQVERDTGLIAIKPSGVTYASLAPHDIVIVDVVSGEVVDGSRRPSTDTPTHLILYRWSASIGGIAHTHSSFATSWAQASRSIPCLGTTHADHYPGPVLVTRSLEPEEIGGGYEVATGRAITSTFDDAGLDPSAVPGVLVSGHGPFVWDDTAAGSVEQAIALEEIAQMAFQSMLLEPSLTAVPDALLHKHYDRKHGRSAYYGQLKH